MAIYKEASIVLPKDLIQITNVNVSEISEDTNGAYDVLFAHTDVQKEVIYYRGLSSFVLFDKQEPMLVISALNMGDESHKINIPLKNSVVILEKGKNKGEGKVTFVLPVNRHSGFSDEEAIYDHITWVSISKKEGIIINNRSNYQGSEPEILRAALLAEKLAIQQNKS